MNDHHTRVTGFAGDEKKTTFFTEKGGYTLRSISYGDARRFVRMPLMVGIGLAFCGIGLLTSTNGSLRTGLGAYAFVLMFAFFGTIAGADEDAGFPVSEILYVISVGYFVSTPMAAMHFSWELVLAALCGLAALATCLAHVITREVWEPLGAALVGVMVVVINMFHPIAGRLPGSGLLLAGLGCLILALMLFVASGSYEGARERIIDD